MIDFLTDVAATAGGVMFHVLLWLLCIVGVIISCVSLSGTWLILLAAILSWWVLGVPSALFLLVLAGVSVLVEILEALSAQWGIRRRGGSNAAGWAALGGGLLGLLLGTWIPVPIVGSLIGMLAGSFLCAYWVEMKRMENAEAAHVARGAVVARIFVIFIKLSITSLAAVIFLFSVYV